MHERVERQRRIADPAEPIIPVAFAAGSFRKAERRRRDDRAGRPIRAGLERDQRPDDEVAILLGRLDLCNPGVPERLGVDQRLLGIDVLGNRVVGTRPRQHVWNALPGSNHQLGVKRWRLRLRTVQIDRIGSGDRGGLAIALALSRHREAVREPRSELASHANVAGHAFDHAHEPRWSLARRHEVDEPDHPCRRLEVSLEDERVATVTTADRDDRVDRGDLPSAVVRRSEQRREARVGVEIWQAEEADRTILGDESSRMKVTDQRVVFDEHRGLGRLLLRRRRLAHLLRRLCRCRCHDVRASVQPRLQPSIAIHARRENRSERSRRRPHAHRDTEASVDSRT